MLRANLRESEGLSTSSLRHAKSPPKGGLLEDFGDTPKGVPSPKLRIAFAHSDTDLHR